MAPIRRMEVFAMIKTVGIVSLSSGIIGEEFVKHEVDLVCGG